MGGTFKREGIYVYLWLIHADMWQRPTQYCKAIILKLKINTFLKKGNYAIKGKGNQLGEMSTVLQRNVDGLAQNDSSNCEK